MSLLKDLADALKEGLAAHEWDSVEDQPTVSRLNWPTIDIEDMSDPVIVVTPGGDTVERVNREAHQHDYTVNVFVGRHTPDEASADAMLELAEEVVDVILAHSWGELTFPASSPQAIAIEINPDEALSDRNAWRAVISVTYRTHR